MIGQRGDTIVEVLFAVTVFSMIAVGALSLMNQGTAMAQRSLEIGLVRDQMDAQADALRYMHNAFVANFGDESATTSAVWNGMAVDHAATEAQPFEEMSNGQTCRLPEANNASGADSDGRPFALDVRKLDGQDDGPVMLLNQAANVDETATYSQIRYPPEGVFGPAKAEGIWVQAVRAPAASGHLGYYDFHIRACWLTPGQSAPVTLGTVVRLYDPAS